MSQLLLLLRRKKTLKPAVNYDLTGGALPSGMTLTRASIGSYFNMSAVLTTATLDVARYAYSPTTHAARGLLCEAQATNIQKYSNPDATNWSVSGSLTSAAGTAPDGSNTMTQFLDTLSTAFFLARTLSGTNYTAGLTYVFSAYAKADAQHVLQITPPPAAFSSSSFANMDLLTQTYNGTGIVAAGFEDVGGGIYRVWAAFMCATTVTNGQGTGCFSARRIRRDRPLTF